MRVAFVNSMRSMGGGERWLMETAGGLRERGHRVAIAARAGSALADRAGCAGHVVLTLPMRGDLDIESILRLARWLRRLDTEVVSVNIERAVRIGCAAARLAGVRAVVERRGLDFRVRPTALNRFVYARCLSRVIANCGVIRDGLVSSGLVSPERVLVVQNGIDPSRVPPGGGTEFRREFGIGEGAPLVAVVGRLVPDKGHRDAIDAFSTAAKELPGARLLIAGSGKLRAELEAYAASSAAAGSVIFAGERSDVPALLDAADTLLVTSYREGAPHVVLEAMVAGTPVVATAVAGIPEMIEDGESGLLVPPGAPELAAAALLKLLGDGELSARLGAEGARRVRDRFSLDRMVTEVERCFELAAASARGEEVSRR